MYLQKLTRIIALFANDHEIGGKKCHFQHTSAIFLKISDLTPFYQKEMARFEKNTLKIFKVWQMNVQYSPRKSSTVTLWLLNFHHPNVELSQDEYWTFTKQSFKTHMIIQKECTSISKIHILLFRFYVGLFYTLTNNVYIIDFQ